MKKLTALLLILCLLLCGTLVGCRNGDDTVATTDGQEEDEKPKKTEKSEDDGSQTAATNPPATTNTPASTNEPATTDAPATSNPIAEGSSEEPVSSGTLTEEDEPPHVHAYGADDKCEACGEAYENIGLLFSKADETYSVVGYPGSEKEVIIPSKYKGIAVTSIGDKAFYNNQILEDIVIPEGVVTIGKQGFCYCDNLKSISIPSTLTAIGEKAFQVNYGYGYNKKVYISDLSAWCKIEFGTSTSGYSDGANPLKNSYLYLNNVAVSEISIPNNVTEISAKAFLCANGIESIIIPNSVTKIGAAAFHEVSATNLHIGNGVTSIGNDAFTLPYGRKITNLYITDIAAWCNIESNNALSIAKNLYINDVLTTDIVIPEGVTNIGCVFKYFEGCTSVTLPSTVTSLDEHAFLQCRNLTTITFPHSITNVGYQAFLYCDKLSTVLYSGTEEQWNAVTFDLSNYNLTNANIIYNYQP